MQRKNTKADGLEVVAVRLEPADIDEIKARAEADRRPWSQWLRNLIHDALHGQKKGTIR